MVTRFDLRAFRKSAIARLKLDAIHDNTPVKLTVELPTDVHRDLCHCAASLRQQTGQCVGLARSVAASFAAETSHSEESDTPQGVA